MAGEVGRVGAGEGLCGSEGWWGVECSRPDLRDEGAIFWHAAFNRCPRTKVSII